MPDFNAIADTGATIIGLFRDKMKDLIPEDSIMLISPGDMEAKDNVRLSFFLYHVDENASLKNAEMRYAGPGSGPANPVLRIQRVAGNQAVLQMVRAGVLQARLGLGQPGDRYERRGARFAKTVTNTTDQGTSAGEKAQRWSK